jgi:hypothetical protein
MSFHEQIRDILLQHIGKQNQISATVIAEMIGVEPGGSGRNIRKLIFETIKKYNLPFGGSNRGYFLIEGKEELTEYINSLYSRNHYNMERARIITAAFYRYYNNEELDLTGEIIDEDDDDEEVGDMMLI